MSNSRSEQKMDAIPKEAEKPSMKEKVEKGSERKEAQATDSVSCATAAEKSGAKMKERSESDRKMGSKEGKEPPKKSPSVASKRDQKSSDNIGEQENPLFGNTGRINVCYVSG